MVGCCGECAGESDLKVKKFSKKSFSKKKFSYLKKIPKFNHVVNTWNLKLSQVGSKDKMKANEIFTCHLF
tara:strand:+ start:5182 stop:5391 length:210 start_codon:yes stop_codon:yes gene_type:complete